MLHLHPCYSLCHPYVCYEFMHTISPTFVLFRNNKKIKKNFGVIDLVRFHLQNWYAPLSTTVFLKRESCNITCTCTLKFVHLPFCASRSDVFLISFQQRLLKLNFEQQHYTQVGLLWD